MENQNQSADKPKLSSRIIGFIKQYVFVSGILFGLVSPQLAKYYDKVVASGVSPDGWKLSLISCAFAIIAGALIGIVIVVIYNKMHGRPIECGEKIECTNKQISMANDLVNRLREIKDTDIRVLISQQIIDDDALTQLEKKAGKGSTIYVISSNFEFEQKEPYKSAIVENIYQGAKYRYIIPTHENAGVFERMVNSIFEALTSKVVENSGSYEEAKEKMIEQFTAIKTEDNFLFLTTVLYELNDREKEVIVKLPYEKTENPENNKYVYKIPKEPVQAWIRLLEKIQYLFEHKEAYTTPTEVKIEDLIKSQDNRRGGAGKTK